MADIPQSVVAQVRDLIARDPKVRGGITRGLVPLDELVALLYEHNGSAYRVAKVIGTSHTNVSDRRRFVEEQLGITLPRGRPEVWKSQPHRVRLDVALDEGVILVGSDLHCWPEIYGAAMAAFVDLNRRLKPDIVILNGDGLDGARISSHMRIGWDKRPTVQEELDALAEYLEQLRKANPNAEYIRTYGNHCMRYETYLATKAPEMDGVKGSLLADHLPGWKVCMGVMVNGNIFIKHRHKSGVHNAWQNVKDAGCHVITGHTHRQHCRPWTNTQGTWYGVDLGMLAPVAGPQFDYMELANQGMSDWRSGLAALTIKSGQLMPPDLASVTDEARGEVYFRGQTMVYEL